MPCFFSRHGACAAHRPHLPLNPNSEMGMAAVSKRGIVAVRRKAVLKHTQSKRWREVWCGPAIAKRLDCVRFIAALSRSSALIDANRKGARTARPRVAGFGTRGRAARAPIEAG